MADINCPTRPGYVLSRSTRGSSSTGRRRRAGAVLPEERAGTIANVVFPTGIDSVTILAHRSASTFITGWPTTVSGWRALTCQTSCRRERPSSVESQERGHIMWWGTAGPAIVRHVAPCPWRRRLASSR